MDNVLISNFIYLPDINAIAEKVDYWISFIKVLTFLDSVLITTALINILK
ncbi:MAG: hypothetical protein BAJALOKI1v1_330014 [Promethearchaeota archaeon]|nr:MAG: hypothetical protein BAJALOKI1v1_330014 [Candidatus Lokiarchaeota archaeon]